MISENNNQAESFQLYIEKIRSEARKHVEAGAQIASYRENTQENNTVTKCLISN